MGESANNPERRARAQRAKEFLISQIVEQAQRDNVPLSEVERKMLYFTESEETLPDMLEVNEQFEKEYNTAKYEKKIAGLLRNAFRRNREESTESESRWNKAVADLRKGDHYLLVMLDQSLQPESDFWIVAGWSFLLAVGGIVAVGLWQYLDNNGWIPGWISDLSFKLVLIGAACLWFLYKLFKLGVLGDYIPFLRSKKAPDQPKRSQLCNVIPITQRVRWRKAMVQLRGKYSRVATKSLPASRVSGTNT